MLEEKEEYVEWREEIVRSLVKSLDDVEEDKKFSKGKINFWGEALALTCVIAVTQYFYPILTIPVILVWIGLSIKSMLVILTIRISQIMALTMKNSVFISYSDEQIDITREILETMKSSTQ